MVPDSEIMDNALDAYARGVPIDAIIEGGPDCDFIESYGEQAIILELLKGTEGIADPRALSRKLSNFWIERYHHQDQLPF
jgi:hypothetical protein